MYQLPNLPYEYNALEPVIDETTMRIHHTKHHQGYVDKLNTALESHSELSSLTIEKLLTQLDKLPGDVQTAVRNNGGGHANHSLFWTVMQAPSQDNQPSNELAQAIEQAFKSFAQFKEQFAAAALGRFGSGWAWLVKDDSGQLQITSTANQDNPIMTGQQPILGLDVWEHAYYLKYQNQRATYIENWWQVENWSRVGERYLA